MRTLTDIKLTKTADGYTAEGGYAVRKAAQEDMYDLYRQDRERMGGVLIHKGRRISPPPKPQGWVVSHPLQELGKVNTLDEARDLIHRHQSGPWWSRCDSFAKAIDVYAVGPESEQDVVLAAVTAFGLTYNDFRELDEKPGRHCINGRSYTDAGSNWHSRLRRVRNNPDADLFDRLRRS